MTSLAAGVQWGSSPVITASFEYEHRRSGSDMQYRVKVTINPLTSSGSYFGYPIYSQITLAGSVVDSETLKAASPSTCHHSHDRLVHCGQQDLWQHSIGNKAVQWLGLQQRPDLYIFSGGRPCKERGSSYKRIYGLSADHIYNQICNSLYPYHQIHLW